MTQFDSSTYRVIAQSQPQSAQRRAVGVHRAQTLSGRGLTFWLQWLTANVALTLLLVTLADIKTGTIDPHYRILVIVTLFGSVPVYSLLQVYYKQHGYLIGLARLLGAWLVLLAGLTALAFVTKTSELYSREVILLWAVLGFAAQAAIFLPLHKLARRYWQEQQAQRTSLIVGYPHRPLPRTCFARPCIARTGTERPRDWWHDAQMLGSCDKPVQAVQAGRVRDH
ncbi:CoA-binding domain-containing protein [Stutzerimonas xanthomarina DSM 18231]|uniref:CoA-binding domain-containing protein n=1 Tax=Stutzerimonas xanthomarina DSM 18231 TaxID=1403346 RepID=A0A1M5P8A9_9GAMM|nr:CoA-binding domain-containing protein [Stutzerimonas xanthomarina DSM 18231]